MTDEFPIERKSMTLSGDAGSAGWASWLTGIPMWCRFASVMMEILFIFTCHVGERKWRVIEATEPCGWSMSFESVIASGTVVFIQSDDAKRDGLNFIMRQYAGEDVKWSFPIEKLEKTVVLKVQLEEISGMVKSGI